MTGLVGWWPLHRTTGDAVDLSGSENHGTVSGATRGVAGKGGLQAFSFDGTDDYVRLPFRFSNAPFTVSSWVYLDTLPTDHSEAILATFDSATNDSLFFGFTWGDNLQLSTYDNSTSTSHNATGTTTVTTGTWYHAVGMWTGSEYRVYLNGALEATTASSTFVGYNADVTVGARQDYTTPDRHLDGQICSIRVYDRVLSAAEIQRLYEWGSGDYATPTGSSDGGVSYWTLDEDSGTTATDSWGTNDGTVTGATVGVTGVRDTAYDFDGTDDLIDVSSLPDLSTGYTISTWGNFDSNSTVQHPITHQYTDSDMLFRFEFSSAAAGSVEFGHTVAGTFSELVSTTTLAANEWYHLAFTSDGTNRRIYINGEVDSEDAPGTPDYSTNQRFSLGARERYAGSSWATDVYMDGSLDDVRVYNRALDPAEVAQVYRYGTRGKDLRKETVNAR